MMNNLKKDYIVAIGGSNVDILGKSNNKIVLNESNPSEIISTPGGVVRNIAENIALLKNDCHLITVFGNDDFGNYLKKESVNKGIKIDNSITIKNAESAIYISVNNHHGEMLVALNNTTILNNLTPNFLKTKESILLNASAIVIDANLSQETINFICKEFKHKYIFADPVSLKKSKKLKKHLGSINIIKPNLSEAKFLLGVKEINKNTLNKVSDRLKKLNVYRMIISLGKKGVISYENDKIKSISLPRQRVNNVNGAGDALMAGLIHGYINHWEWDYTVLFSLAMASLSTQSPNTVNFKITEASVKKYLKEIIIT